MYFLHGPAYINTNTVCVLLNGDLVISCRILIRSHFVFGIAGALINVLYNDLRIKQLLDRVGRSLLGGVGTCTRIVGVGAPVRLIKIYAVCACIKFAVFIVVFAAENDNFTGELIYVHCVRNSFGRCKIKFKCIKRGVTQNS